MPLKVIVFAGFFLPFRGGYANSIFQVAQRLVQKGHQVTVVTSDTERAGDSELVEGVDIMRLSCWNMLGGTYPVPKPTLANLRTLRNIRTDNRTVISTQTRFFVTTLLGVVFSLCRRVPLVHTERGSYHSIVNNRLVYFISVVIDHIFGWIIALRARRLVGVSTKASEFLKHLGARQPMTVPNGVNEAYIRFGEKKNAPADSGAELGVLYFGRLIYAKGVQDLLVAARRLTNEKSLGIHVYVVGDGNYRNELEKLVREYNLSEKVSFTGELASDGIMSIMKKCDVFVNPSYSEGLPTSVLEAAAAGLPVIAADVGGTRDIITDGISGLLYQAHDIDDLTAKLRRVLSNKVLRTQMSEKLRHWVVETFSWEKVTQTYEDIFTSVIT